MKVQFALIASPGYFGMESDQSEMASIRPDELPGLLNTCQTGGPSAWLRNGIGNSGAGSSGLTVPPAFGSSPGSPLGSQTGASGFPQEARLEKRTGFPLQPCSFPKTPRGPTETANKKSVFVIRADGSVVSGPGGLFSGGVKGTAMQPGDMVVVPEKVITVSRARQNTVQTAQILSAVALAVTAARTF